MYKRHKLLMENDFLLQVYKVFGSLKLGSAPLCIVIHILCQTAIGQNLQCEVLGKEKRVKRKYF